MNDHSSVLDAAEGYLEQNTALNRRIIDAADASSRKQLLGQKNGLIEELEFDLKLCETRPEAAPDLPVFDLVAMDDLISREAELEKRSSSDTPEFDLRKTIGFSVAMALFMFTIGLISIQLIEYSKDLKPKMSAAEERRSQVEDLLNAVGNTQEINTTTSIEDLREKLGFIREAVGALASGGTDEYLEELVNQRREEIKKRLFSLSKEQRS